MVAVAVVVVVVVGVGVGVGVGVVVGVVVVVAVAVAVAVGVGVGVGGERSNMTVKIIIDTILTGPLGYTLAFLSALLILVIIGWDIRANRKIAQRKERERLALRRSAQHEAEYRRWLDEDKRMRDALNQSVRNWM